MPFRVLAGRAAKVGEPDSGNRSQAGFPQMAARLPWGL